MYQLKHPLTCLSEKYSTHGGVSRQIQYSALPCAVFVSRHTPSCCIFYTDAQQCFNIYMHLATYIELQVTGWKIIVSYIHM